MKTKHLKFYGNQDVFATNRSQTEKRAPVLQRDLEKNALKTVEWFQTVPLTWAQIRDQHARCLALPKGQFFMGPPFKRNCVEIHRGGPGDHIRQFKGPRVIGSVTALDGAAGSVLNRSSFVTDVGIQMPNFTNTNSLWHLTFLTGDMAGITRNVVTYNQGTGRVTIYDPLHAPGGQMGDPLPGWDGRTVRVGDRFKIHMVKSYGEPTTCTRMWESTSRVYREPYSNESPSIYKSIRFKYSKYWAPGVANNLIGDDPNVPGNNLSITDGTVLYLRWKEITYLIEPVLVPVMPSEIFPDATTLLSHRQGYWPPQQQVPGTGVITSVTARLVGNYTPPGAYAPSLPVYVWDVVYAPGGPINTRTYEFPAFYRPLGVPKGFHLEMWAQKSRRTGPWPVYGCSKVRTSFGGGKAFVKAGEWIYLRQTNIMGLPGSPRNPVKQNSSFRIRFRNFKDGGLSLPSRQKVSLKYRQIRGYMWNIPYLEE